MDLGWRTIFSLIAIVAFVAGTNAAMAFYSLPPEQKLEYLLGNHFFRGEIITPDIKAATGDPNIPVIDHRKYGDWASCHFRYQRGRRQGRLLYCQ